jgi:succinyl-diaminopimelate desuccinylase
MNIATIHGGLNTNSVPDSVKLTVDLRTVPGIDHAHLCQSLGTLLGSHANVRKIIDTAPLYTEPENEWIQSVFDLMATYLGTRPTAKTIMFSTDGADLKRGYDGPPALILGPGEPSVAHQTDEWCSVTRIDQSVDAFTAIMKDWCGV